MSGNEREYPTPVQAVNIAIRASETQGDGIEFLKLWRSGECLEDFNEEIDFVKRREV